MAQVASRRRLSRPLLGLLCCATVLLALSRSFSSGLQLLFSSTARPSSCQKVQQSEPGRRQAAMLLSSAIAAGAAVPRAEAMQQFDIKKAELVKAPPNTKTGVKGFMFEKPAGFKRFTSPVDPSGYVFRNVNDTYFTFATRAELRPNASTDFKPEDFINDYRSKFVNATGSSFDLIKGGGAPTRVDPDLNVKYYEVEYVIRTQLGFAFDSLKTLHFITTFAVSQDCINIINCQALDDKWEENGPILKRVTETFLITG